MRMIFVNLPVTDLKASMAFYEGLGFANNPQFTDENAACMVLSDEAFVMLLAEPFFRTFVKKEVPDAATHTGVIVAISADSREEVDALVGAALDGGAAPANDPMDPGFMYLRSFYDPNGYLWEVVWMDESTLQQ